MTNLNNNKKIWIPDLVPVQIGMFGFSQTSEYKVCIKDYVEVMGLSLRGPINQIQTIKEKIWDLQSSHWTFNPKYYKIVDNENNDSYSAQSFHMVNELGVARTEKLYMSIRPRGDSDDMFGDKEWIKIFDHKLMRDVWSYWSGCLDKDHMTSFMLCTRTSLINE